MPMVVSRGCLDSPKLMQEFNAFFLLLLLFVFVFCFCKTHPIALVQRARTQHEGVRSPGGSADRARAELPTHLVARLAGEPRGQRRSGNPPVWILILFHTFPPIKFLGPHIIIKEKT